MAQKLRSIRSAVGLAAALVVVLIGSAFSLSMPVEAAGPVQPHLTVPLQATPLPPAGATEPARVAPPLSLTLTLLCTCGAVGLVVGVLVLGLVARRQAEAGSDNKQAEADR